MKPKFDRVSQFLIGWAYTFILTYLMGVILYPSVPLLGIAVLSLTAYLIVSVIFITRISGNIFLVLLGVCALGTGALYFMNVPASAPVIKIIDNIVMLWEKITWNEPHEEPVMMQAALIFLILTAVVASIVVVLLYKKHFSFFILTGLCLAMTIFSWYMTGKESRLTFALLCTLTILGYIRHVYAKKKKLGLVSDQLPLGNLMLFTLPLALIPVVVIAFIPKNDLPIQWPWLDSKIMHAIEYMEQRFSYSDSEFFSLSTTGFTGTSHRLGGPVRPSNTVVMDVKADKRTYLRGAIYSWYDKNSWYQNSKENEDVLVSNENQQDIQESSQGWAFIPVDTLFPNVIGDDKQLLTNLSQNKLYQLFFPNYKLQVKFRNMTTRTVFIPLKPMLPIHRLDKTPMNTIENNSGALISDVKLPSGSTYSVVYFQPMYGEPMFKKALTFSRKGLYKDALVILNSQRAAITGASDDTKRLSSQDYLDLTRLNQNIQNLSTLVTRADIIETEYTKLNDNLPQRVKDLAINLTKNDKSDYEKVITIQDYLRNNYDYTLNTKVVPQGHDFVDYFLFDDRKGYCTYYATAMAVLLRSINIPARYVEGYVLPEESSSDGVYTVSNKNAHAWVEVYFEGFGWLTFEPTTVFADVMDFRSTMSTGGGYDGPYIPEIDEMMKRYRGSSDIPGYVPVTNDGKNQFDLGKVLSYVPWVLAGMLVLSLIINIMAMLIGNIVTSRLKNGRKVLRVYESMLQWLFNVGYSIKPGETVTEFSKRIDKMYLFSEYDFKEVTKIFSKVRYGQQEVSPEEVIIVKKVSRELRRKVLKEMGIRRYMPLRRIFLGI